MCATACSNPCELLTVPCPNRACPRGPCSDSSSGPWSQLHDRTRRQHVPPDREGAPEEAPFLQPSFAASMAQAAELMSRAKVPMRMQPRGGDPLLRAVVGCGVQWPNESKEGRDVARKRLTPSSRSEAMMLASSLDAELGEAADLRRQMLAYDKAFAELVRQVHLHCAERGALLERCRVQQHAWTTRLLLALKVCDRYS